MPNTQYLSGLPEDVQEAPFAPGEDGEGTAFNSSSPTNTATEHTNTQRTSQSADSFQRPDAPLGDSHETKKTPPVALRILVAEDNPSNRHLMQLYFKSEPHNIAFVTNGEEALEQWRKQTFDLIFMDIEMPLMDGLRATRIIREEELTSGREHTPIIALTAHALPAQRRKSEAAGCDSHLVKPFKRHQITEVIGRFVKNT